MSRGIRGLRDDLARSRTGSRSGSRSGSRENRREEGAIPMMLGDDEKSTLDIKSKMSKLKKLSQKDKELIAALQEKLEEQKRDLEKRSGDLTVLMKNVERMASMSQSRIEQMKKLKTEVNELRLVKSSLTTQVEEQQRGMARMTQTLDAKDKQIEELTNKNEDLTNKNKEVWGDLKTAQDLIEQLKKELSEREGAAAQGESSWKKKLENLKREYEAYKKSTNTVMERMNKEMKEKDTKMKTLEKAAKASKKEIDDLKAKLKALQKELKDLKAANSQSSSSASEIKKELMKTIEDLQNQCKKLRAQIAKLEDQKKKDDITIKEQAQTIETTTKECEKLRKKVPELEKEIARLKAALSEGSNASGKELEDLRARVKQLVQENSEKQAKIQSLRDEIEDLLKKLRDMESASGDNPLADELRKKLEEAEKEIKRLTDLMSKRDLTSKEVKDVAAKLHHAQEAMEGLFTCINCLELFKEPTMTKCGHTFCKECVIDRKGCWECGVKMELSSSVKNDILSMLSGKFVNATQVLAKLRGVLAAM